MPARAIAAMSMIGRTTVDRSVGLARGCSAEYSACNSPGSSLDGAVDVGWVAAGVVANGSTGAGSTAAGGAANNGERSGLATTDTAGAAGVAAPSVGGTAAS